LPASPPERSGRDTAWLAALIPAPPSGDLGQDPQVALADLINAIDALAEIKLRTGMAQPTVIT